jgi:hypothetical protein
MVHYVAPDKVVTAVDAIAQATDKIPVAEQAQ